MLDIESIERNLSKQDRIRYLQEHTMWYTERRKRYSHISKRPAKMYTAARVYNNDRDIFMLAVFPLSLYHHNMKFWGYELRLIRDGLPKYEYNTEWNRDRAFKHSEDAKRAAITSMVELIYEQGI